jgi:sugar lactone lactonase YvrE
MKKLLVSLVALLVAAAAYLLLWPVPIEPVAWQAPLAPKLEGSYAPNDYLASTVRLADGIAMGPETTTFDREGRIYAGLSDGRILRLDSGGRNPETYANTGGRPLGLAFDASDNLIVADAFKGLLAIGPDLKPRTLATTADGLPFGFTDDVDVATDGKIYFSDASSKFGFGHHMEDVLEHAAHGRLLRYDPEDGKTTVLMDGINFANGVALGPHDEFVLVNETGSYRVLRYWLKGPKSGQHDVFIDNLPGIPDGISRGYEGVFWVALFSPRVPDLDAMSGKPFLRKLAFRLPQALQPKPVMHGFVLGLNPDGQVIYNLQDASATAYAPITSVEQKGDMLYLGSLTASSIGRVPAP